MPSGVQIIIMRVDTPETNIILYVNHTGNKIFKIVKDIRMEFNRHKMKMSEGSSIRSSHGR